MFRIQTFNKFDETTVFLKINEQDPIKSQNRS